MTSYLTTEQLEHLASYAAEHGDSDTEEKCDAALAGDDSVQAKLIDLVNNDADLTAWMERCSPWRRGKTRAA